MYKNVIKPISDFLIALQLLLLFFPLLVLCSIAIKLDSRGPLFFFQERVGKDLKYLLVPKFRTMTNENREVGTKPIIGKSEGVTRVGFYLRRFKIDELPQLVNLLNGQMSLVGPRPNIPSHLDNMTDEEKKRYSVRPGLTGLAQVSGNIHISWPERFKKDLEYVRNISLFNDLKIIMRTIHLIFVGEAYYANKPMRFERD